MNIHWNNTCRFWVVFAFTLWLLIISLFISTEAKRPSPDVFLFKEAGVNLATQGRFVAADLPHTPPGESVVYAYYLPIYPFLYGVWSTFFGVGLKQSLIFDYLIKLVRTILLATIIWHWLKPRLNYADKRAIALVCFFVGLCFLPFSADRPDELGLVFGLLAWVLLLQEYIGWGQVFFSGVFLGLSAATSPAASLYMGLGAVGLLIYVQRVFHPMFLMLGTALFTLFLTVVPVLTNDSHAWTRLMAQVPGSVLPLFLSENASLRTGFGELFRLIWSSGKWVTIPLALLGIWAHKLYKTVPLERGLEFVQPMIQVSLAFIPFSILVFTRQSIYLWFPWVILFTLVGLLWLLDTRRQWVTGIILFIALLPGLGWETLNILTAVQRPHSQHSDIIKQRVVSRMKSPEKSLAIGPDQFFTFRSLRNLAMVQYVCNSIERFDYVYLTPQTARHVQTEEVAPPCGPKGACFQRVDDFRETKHVKVFGWETPLYVRGNGGVLFENTHCENMSYADASNK